MFLKGSVLADAMSVSLNVSVRFWKQIFLKGSKSFKNDSFFHLMSSAESKNAKSKRAKVILDFYKLREIFVSQKISGIVFCSENSFQVFFDILSRKEWKKEGRRISDLVTKRKEEKKPCFDHIMMADAFMKILEFGLFGFKNF